MRKIVTGIVAAALVLGLAGCSGGDSGTEAEPETTSPEAIETAEAEEEGTGEAEDAPKEMPAWTNAECEEAGVALRAAKSTWYDAIDEQGGSSDNWIDLPVEERLAAAQTMLDGKNRLTEGLQGEELQNALTGVGSTIRLTYDDNVPMWITELKAANPDFVTWQQLADLGVAAIGVGAPNQALWDSLDTAGCAP